MGTCVSRGGEIMSVKPIKAKVGNNEDFEQIPAGVYLARCYKMVDIGTQNVHTAKWGDKDVRQVILSWELLQDDDGNPVFMKDGESIFSISKKYTLSMNKKANMRKDLDSWRGKPFTDKEADDFDITKLLDKFCKLQVVHTTTGDKTYSNVATLMNTTKTAKGVNEVIGFSIDDPDMEVFAKLPQWQQDKIREAAEWADEDEVDEEVTRAVPANELGEDEIDASGVPF